MRFITIMHNLFVFLFLLPFTPFLWPWMTGEYLEEKTGGNWGLTGAFVNVMWGMYLLYKFGVIR